MDSNHQITHQWLQIAPPSKRLIFARCTFTVSGAVRTTCRFQVECAFIGVKISLAALRMMFAALFVCPILKSALPKKHAFKNLLKRGTATARCRSVVARKRRSRARLFALQAMQSAARAVLLAVQDSRAVVARRALHAATRVRSVVAIRLKSGVAQVIRSATKMVAATQRLKSGKTICSRFLLFCFVFLFSASPRDIFAFDTLERFLRGFFACQSSRLSFDDDVIWLCSHGARGPSKSCSSLLIAPTSSLMI